jgi:hypothetical protein
MSTPEALYQQKRMAASDAASLIRDGDTVVVPPAWASRPRCCTRCPRAATNCATSR